jgi:HAD superfamily hydrolase (TIGR01490 family)
MPRRAAFFDVDGTLLRGVSLFRFLAYDLDQDGAPPGALDQVMAENRRLKADGVPHEEVNRAFYRHFAGRSVRELLRRGERWWAREESAGLLDPLVLGRLREHRAGGDLVVLVSGSFPPCLDPIARRARADAVLCTRPEVRDGRYTGAVEAPMIGPYKVTAVRAFAAEQGLDLARSHAYGDHDSDAPMLAAVGHPVVVGGDPGLRRTAQARGWASLTGHHEHEHEHDHEKEQETCRNT